MVLEGGTRLVSDRLLSAESVVRSRGIADVATDADGGFGFLAGGVPEDVVVAHRPAWDGTGEGPPTSDPVFDGAAVEAVVVITSPFDPHPSGVLPRVGTPRTHVPAFCCYTTSAGQTPEGVRRFLLLAHEEREHVAAARRDEGRGSARVWCAVVEVEPGSGEAATLVDELWTTRGELDDTRAGITHQHGEHHIIDLPSTADVERAAHADAVRCALTHQHQAQPLPHGER